MKNVICAAAMAVALPLTFSSAACANAASTPAATTSFDEAARALAESGTLNGAVLVALGDEVVFSEGYGTADPDTGAPFTASTPSRVASITKQFTAATILRLVEQDRLDLDATIGELLPWFPQGPAHAITVSQLLNHSSGLARPAQGDMVETAQTSAKDRIAAFAEMPLQFAPGTQHRYSNSGYAVLGAIIEKVTGLSYAEAVTALVLQPLDLEATMPLADYQARPGLAISAVRDGSALKSDDYRISDRGAPWSAGMMTSTVADLFRWTRALHGGEVFDDAATLQTMLETPGGWEENRAFDNWAYASGLFRARRDNGRAFVFHDGRLGSYLADLRYYPEADLTIAVLETANGDVTATADRLEELAFAKLKNGELVR